jgi:hypothetical protein
VADPTPAYRRAPAPADNVSRNRRNFVSALAETESVPTLNLTELERTIGLGQTFRFGRGETQSNEHSF